MENAYDSGLREALRGFGFSDEPSIGHEWGVWSRLGDQGWLGDPETGIPYAFTNYGVAYAFTEFWLRKANADPATRRLVDDLRAKDEASFYLARFNTKGRPALCKSDEYVWEDGVGLVKKPQEAPE